MAQVRKLKNGESIPKEQNKYKYILDNQEVYLTDDNLNTINDRIAALPAKYKRFLGNATEAIKSGEESGNRADNTVTMNQLSGLNKSNERRLEKQKPSTIEALFHTDSYDAKEAINEYLKIINDVVNTKSSKKKLDSSSISLDFNEDESGNKYLSSTAGENLSARNRIATILEQLNAGDSEYDLSAYDSIRDWMNGLDGEDKYKAATDYLTDLWTRMGAAGYAYNPDDEDFLRNFEIIYGLSKPIVETPVVTEPLVTTATNTNANSEPSITTQMNDNSSKTSETIDLESPDSVQDVIIPTSDSSKPIIQSLPTPSGEKKTIRVRKLPYITSGVRGYEGKDGELTAEHVGNFSTRTMSYKIFRDDNGNYTFVSGIGNYPYDRIGRMPITEELVQQILSGNIPKDLEKNLHYSENQVPNWLYDLPKNLLNAIQLSTPAGRMFARRQYGPISVLTEKQGGIIKAQSGNQLPSALVWDYKKPMPSLNGRDTEWERFITKRIGIAGLKDPGLNGTPTTGLLNPNPANIPTAQATTNTRGLLDKRSEYLRNLSQSNNVSDNRSDGEGGGYTKNLSGMSILPLISAGRFALTSHFQNKYNRQGKAAIEAGRYHEIAPILNAPTTDNPILDRAIRNIQSERMLGIKPVTSDYIQNNAIKQQRESQLFDRERELTGQRSQDYTDKLNQILAVNNQNINAATQVANANRARDAAIDSAKLQQDQILTQQRAQSWDNLGLEAETNLKNDLDILRALERNRFVTNQTKAYQEALKGRIGDDLYNQWENLGTKQDEYDDIVDWLYKTNKSEYDSRGIGTWNKEQIQNMRNLIDQWDANNVRTYFNIRPDGWLSNLLFGKTSSIGIARKGGTLRGNTRYKNEPDEQIWIDNNKATQQAIAKLSDNVIKLLLRALK